MKSRITIEVDFNKNQPYLQIVSYSTDDVRDKLIKELLYRLQYSSRLFRLGEANTVLDNGNGEGYIQYKIFPVEPKDLKVVSEEAMEDFVKYDKLAPNS